MIALRKCQKWKEQVKVSNHRKFWIFNLFIEALVRENKQTFVCLTANEVLTLFKRIDSF
jgi:hypothetical protein